MFWLPFLLIGAAIVTVSIITIAILLKEVKKFLRKKEQELKRKNIEIIEIQIKKVLEKGGAKEVHIGLTGKTKKFGIIPWNENLGTLHIKGEKIDDELYRKKKIRKTVKELLS